MDTTHEVTTAAATLEVAAAPPSPPDSAMDQCRDLRMREYLDCLAAEDDRGDAVAAVRGHDDKVTAFRFGGIEDRLVGMLMLDMDRLACDAYRLRCVGDSAKGLLGMPLHACFVLRRCILEHLRVAVTPIFHDVAQCSEGYDHFELGIPTSSHFNKIITPQGKSSKLA
jgi:hypothetical protein